jgi:hypothetical protein
MGSWSEDLFKHKVSFVRRTFPDLRNTRHKILEWIILNAAARNHLTGGDMQFYLARYDPAPAVASKEGRARVRFRYSTRHSRGV